LATKHFLGWVERRAMCMRAKLSLSPRAPLNPYTLATVMEAIILTPTEIDGLSAEDHRQLVIADAKSWSAGSIHLPQGGVAILLNPTHSETRKNATLMEELSHIYLAHVPSQLIIVNGMAVRSFKKTQETQAYWVGSAALIPLVVLQEAQLNQLSRMEIAHNCKVSQALVAFRENVTGIRLSQ
jgi:IrrE N-terminal-like domain